MISALQWDQLTNGKVAVETLLWLVRQYTQHSSIVKQKQVFISRDFWLVAQVLLAAAPVTFAAAAAAATAGGSMRPVATYLAICEGAKLVLLLPPNQTLLPPGGDPDILLNPTPQFLADIRAAGGYFFLLEDLPDKYSSWNSRDFDNFSATALYMPAGWHHWLVGLTDWHIVYGGSFYPEKQAWLQPLN